MHPSQVAPKSGDLLVGLKDAEVVLGGNPPAGGCFGGGGGGQGVPSILPVPAGYRSRETLSTVLRGVTAFSKRQLPDARDKDASRGLVPPAGGVKPTAHFIYYITLSTSC